MPIVAEVAIDIMDSAGEAAPDRSMRGAGVCRVSPCLLGAFLVGGRRLDRAPAPFRPGGAIEVVRRSMAEQCPRRLRR